MSIRCLFGRHDWEKFGEGETKLSLITRAARTAALRLWYGPVSHQSEIYDRLCERERDEGRLYDADGYVDRIHDIVCLRCGKIDEKIKTYSRYLNHKASVIGLLIRHREDRQALAKKLTDSN